ncbi:MAG: LysR substrate-binding domain-containing protein [Bdellovibrionota bacterium]
MLSIDQLRYIVALAQKKHFGQAARECHISQPSLSAQIQKAEEQLGTIIFDRSKKPILLTDAGVAIVDQARKVLKEHAALQKIADTRNSHPKGEFHLGIIPTLSPYVVPLFLESFATAYPDVQLRINEYKTEDIVRLLVDDRLDAGLLVTPLEDDRLIEKHLFFEPFFVYASDHHPLTKKKQVLESELTTDDLWLLEEGHCFRSQVLRICSLDKTQSVFSNVQFEGGSLETLRKMVLQSRGYTLLPKLATYEIGKAEAKKHLRSFRKPVPTREVSLVYSRSFLKEVIMKALEQSIVEGLPPEIRSLKKQDHQIIDI